MEKLQWEAMTSNQRVEQIQKDLKGVQGEISSFMLVFEGLARNVSTLSAKDYDAVSCASDHNPDLVSQCPLVVLSLVRLFFLLLRVIQL